MSDDNIEEFDSPDEEEGENPSSSAAGRPPAVSADDVEPEMDEFAYQLKYEELERKRKEQQEGTVAGSASSHIYTDPNDGTVYEWDFEKNAWFPKIDEDFIAKYQAGYGSHKLDLTPVGPAEQPSSNSSAQNRLNAEQRKEMLKQEKKAKRKLAAEKAKHAGWFEIDESHNTNVYVSGLPLTYTMEQFEELMSKCGIIARDFDNKQLKLKLYKDSDGNLKGDGRCCYIKRESVELALQILDGSLVGKSTIHVEPAHFEQKGDFDPAKKKKKLSAKQKKKLREKEERLFDWHPEKLRGERPKSDRTVVLKNVFSFKEFLENPARLLEIKEELKNECSKYGEVSKIVVYENNDEGVATVNFKTAEEADDCITMMNYRVFHGKQIRAETWDGKTKFKVEETKEDEEKRLSSWHDFLDADTSSTTAAAASVAPQS